MNARFVFACAAAGIAMTAFGAGTASAEETNKGTLEFEFNNIFPGTETRLFGTCDDPNFTSAKVVSEALVAGDLTGTPDGNGVFQLEAQATVADVDPGVYPVSFQCGITTVSADFTVTEEDSPPSVAEIRLDPRQGKAGDTIGVGVPCEDGSVVTDVLSNALEVGELERVGGDPDAMPVWFADATVRDVRAGDYEVTARCGDVELSTTFTVTGGAAPVKDQVPVKPKGAADTGSAEPGVAAATEEDGTDTGLLIGAGVALAAAAGGAGVWAYRRRQQH